MTKVNRTRIRRIRPDGTIGSIHPGTPLPIQRNQNTSRK